MMLVMQEEKSGKDRREHTGPMKCKSGIPRSAEDAFTLIELMIVVLVIAALVAIAIPLFFAIGRNAAEAVAKQNHDTGGKCMNWIWCTLVSEGRDNYVDMSPPPPLSPGPTGFMITANYASRVETNVKWAQLTPSGGRLYVNQVWQNGRFLHFGQTQDWDRWLVGKIGIMNFCWDGAGWTNDNNRYITVLAVDTSNGVAHYTTFQQGSLHDSGTFEWCADGTGHP